MTSKILAQTLLVVCLIAFIRSETVWIDIKTGKFVGISVKINSPIYTTGFPLTDEENSSEEDVWNCKDGKTGIKTVVTNEIMMSVFPELFDQPRRLGANSNKRSKRDVEIYGQFDIPGSFPVKKLICSNSKNKNWVIINNNGIVDQYPDIFTPKVEESTEPPSTTPGISWGDLDLIFMEETAPIPKIIKKPTPIAKVLSDYGAGNIDARSLPLKPPQDPK